MPTSNALPAPCRGLILGLVLGFGLSACASTEEGPSQTEVVRDLVRHGRFVDAVNASSELVDQRPDDPEARLLHRDASVAYLVALGRSKTFGGDDLEAMKNFRKAANLDPESEVALNWINKTNAKLAERWFERASGMHASENLEGARMAYEQALTHQAAHLGAREGLAQVSLQQNYRAGQTDTYYNLGVRAITDWRLEEAKHRFQGAGKYGGETPRVERRVADVNRELAAQRVTVAQQLEKDGLHTAARNDYRVASLMDPTNTDAAQGYLRARLEAEVTRLLDEAKMWVLRGEYGKSALVLDEARATTKTQSGLVDEAMADIESARASGAYEDALNLEHDFRYQQAIAAYEKVIEDYGYDLAQDSRARVTTLTDYLVDAKELYAEAKAAGTDDERRDLLRQIEVFWPEYLDIQAQLQALKSD
jgi:tetratricopeptide (TPR) repeat protein